MAVMITAGYWLASVVVLGGVAIGLATLSEDDGPFALA